MTKHKPDDLDRMQRMVGEWAERTFPLADNTSIANHFTEEAEEFSLAAYLDHDGYGNYEEEAADCLLLLLHFAHRNKFSLFDAAAAKHAVNTQRTWETDDNGRGYWKHQQPVPAPSTGSGQALAMGAE